MRLITLRWTHAVQKLGFTTAKTQIKRLHTLKCKCHILKHIYKVELVLNVLASAVHILKLERYRED